MYTQLSEEQQGQVKRALTQTLGHDFVGSMDFIALVLIPNNGRKTFIGIKERTPIEAVTVTVSTNHCIKREDNNDHS